MRFQHFLILIGSVLGVTGALQAQFATATPPPPPTPIVVATVAQSAAVGWSCGDFPCADDIAGWQRRIRVPDGFALTLAGRFPGQVNQLAQAPDGSLYATVLENGTLQGAIWRMTADGNVTRLSPTLNLPYGLVFQPGTTNLFVSGRTTPLSGGAVWLLLADGTLVTLVDTLPCCLSEVDNQPNGLAFGTDGALYVGVGAQSDHGEDARGTGFRDAAPLEGAVVRFDPTTGTLESFATGLRNPTDLTQDTRGQWYATDQGLYSGIGDRLVTVNAGVNYGFPYYRERGCEECPPSRGNNFAPPDVHAFAPYSLPKGLTAYTGTQFPPQFLDTLFVALWNAPLQQIAWIDPRDPALVNATLEVPYVPTPFVTGLLRPSDVIVADDGALLIADWLYGYIWRVTYTGIVTAPTRDGFVLPTPASAFATNTPLP